MGGQTILVRDAQDQVAGIWVYQKSQWHRLTSNLPTYRDLHRLNQGDIVSLHDSFSEVNYEVLQPFTPIASAELYIEQGILKPSNAQATKQWVDKSYQVEDIIESENSQKFYRTIRPFTPASSELATLQGAENTGYIQKIVIRPTQITPRLAEGISVNGIGNTQITLTSKENSETTQTVFFGGRVQYGQGTFAL